MKSIIKPNHLKIIIPGLGILGAALRWLLYATGMDEKGLLVRSHWAGVLTWLLTAAAVLLLILGCRKLKGSRHYRRCYPASISGGIGCLAGAVGFLLTGLQDRRQAGSSLDSAVVALCVLSAAALVWVGICRLRRKKPFFPCHALVCLYLALRMVGQYRVWSADPQMLDYVFYMTAHVMLMLTGYHMAAFDAGMGSHQKLWFFGLASVYLCLLSIPGSRAPLFMAGCAVWVLTNLPSLNRRRRPTPAPMTAENSEQ